MAEKEKEACVVDIESKQTYGRELPNLRPEEQGLINFLRDLEWAR